MDALRNAKPGEVDRLVPTQGTMITLWLGEDEIISGKRERRGSWPVWTARQRPRAPALKPREAGTEADKGGLRPFRLPLDRLRVLCGLLRRGGELAHSDGLLRDYLLLAAHVSVWLRPDPAPKSERAALREPGHE